MDTELARVRDDIKRTVTMAEVLRICGMPDPDRSHKIRSLANPTEKTPSLHVYEFDWYDYATGQGGDQISFVQAATGASYMDALRILGRDMPAVVKPRAHAHDMPWEPPDLTEKFKTVEESNWEHFEEWKAVVGEKWPTLHVYDLFSYGCKIIKSGDLWIPHIILNPHDNVRYVRGIKVRHLPDAAKSAVTGSAFTVGLYRPHPWAENATHAILVEGESDAWVMNKLLLGRKSKRDVTVLALPSGAGTLKDRYLEEMLRFETVGIATDDDEPGQKARDWVLGDGRVSSYPIEVPGGRVAEAVADGWTL
jgi:hypothetical protein